MLETPIDNLWVQISQVLLFLADRPHNIGGKQLLWSGTDLPKYLELVSLMAVQWLFPCLVSNICGFGVFARLANILIAFTSIDYRKISIKHQYY